MHVPIFKWRIVVSIPPTIHLLIWLFLTTSFDTLGHLNATILIHFFTNGCIFFFAYFNRVGFSVLTELSKFLSIWKSLLPWCLINIDGLGVEFFVEKQFPSEFWSHYPSISSIYWEVQCYWDYCSLFYSQF